MRDDLAPRRSASVLTSPLTIREYLGINAFGRGFISLLLSLANLMTVASAFADPVKVRFASPDSADGLKVMNQLAKEFGELHPNIHAESVFVPQGGDFFQKILLMFAANTQPDVINIGCGNQVPLATRHAIQDLGPYIAKSPDIRLENYFPNSLNLFTFDGKLYALPRALVPTGLIYYNKNLLRKAGLSKLSADWTWSLKPRPELRERDLLWVLDRLTKRNGSQVVQYGMGIAWPQLWFQTLLTSSGLKVWDSNENPTKMLATDSKVEALMQFVADSVYKYRYVPSQNDLSGLNTSSTDQFIQGKLPMFQSGAWEIGNFRKNIKDFEWDVVPFPAHDGDVRRSLGSGSGFALVTGAKHPAEAWEFIKFMTGRHAQTLLAQAGSEIPSYRELALTRGVWLPKDPNASPTGMGHTVTAASVEQMDIVPDWFVPITVDVQSTAYHILNSENPVHQTLAELQVQGTRDMAFAKIRHNRRPFPWLIAGSLAGVLALSVLVWLFWPTKSQPITKQERAHGRTAIWFLVPWVLGLGLVFGPMLYSLVISFAESDLITPTKFAALENYTDAFKDKIFLISVRQTFLFALMSVPVGTMAALVFALLLNQSVKGIRFFRGLYYVPSLVSGVAMGLIWLRVFNPESGLINTILYGPDGHGNFLGLGRLLSWLAGTPGKPVEWLTNAKTVLPALVIMGAWGAGGGAIIFLAGLQGISKTYYEAAMIDGATAWQRLRKITLPLLTPTTFFVLTTGIIGSLQVYTQSVVMTQGGEPDHATEFYMVHLVAKAFNELRIGYANALAWILFAMILVLTLIQFRLANRWVYYEGGNSS